MMRTVLEFAKTAVVAPNIGIWKNVTNFKRGG